MAMGPKGTGAAVLALMLVVSGTADAAGAHGCPHHDAPPATASHGAHPADHAHEPGSDSGSHGPCTCFGRCHAGEAPTLASPGAGQDLAVPTAPPLAVMAPPPSLRPAIVPFTLPWGNAPPRL